MSNKGRKKKTLVCYRCKFVYETRAGKNQVHCPKCGRKHHTGKLFGGLVRDNRRLID